MRWKPKQKAKDGDIRTIEKFCWLPTWDGNQYVWFEKVKLKQVARRMTDPTTASEWISWQVAKEEDSLKKQVRPPIPARPPRKP